MLLLQYLGIVPAVVTREGVSLKVRDYFENGRRALILLQEKGGKERTLPAHHLLEGYMDAYIAAAGIAGEK